MPEENALAARLRQVIADGVVADAEAWCEAAGLSRGFLSSFFVRARENPEASLRGPSVQKLARAAGVEIPWLLDGEGPRTREQEDPADELGPYEAARAWFLAEQRLEGRGDEAKAFLAVRRSYAGAEDKGPGWWLEHLKDEFRAWRKGRGA